MSYLSDFKSAPLSLFGINGGNTTTTDQSISSIVGSPFQAEDGRTFTLVQVGASAIASGLLVQSPASIGANHTDLAVVGSATVNPIGATQITVTLGGTLVTANQYSQGYAIVSAGTGIGQTFQIASHPAQATTTGNVVLTLADALSVALDTTSTISLVLPQYGSGNGTNVGTLGVIVNPTTATGRVIGATLYPLVASTSTVPAYGYIQTSGAIGVINGSTTAIGLDVMPSSATAGNVITYIAATRNRVGTSTVAGQTGKAELITLQL